MKKFILLLILSLSLLNCSKSDNEDYDEGIIVSDAESLMKAMIIPGSTIKNGEIPVPSGTPSDNIGSMPSSIVVTSNSSFKVPFILNTIDGRVPRLVFIKLEGSDSYFEIELNNQGEVVGKSSLEKLSIIAGGNFDCKGRGKISLSGGALVNDQYTNTATVRTYSPPVAVPLDTSWMEDINFWSEPKEITFKCYEVGTGDIQISLTWDTQSDVDIWLTEPDGNKIYYDNPSSSSGGELDFDNTYAYGPENIFYIDEAPSGTYKVEVNYYSGSPQTTSYNVVVKNGSSINNYSGTLQNFDQTNLITTFTK